MNYTRRDLLDAILTKVGERNDVRARNLAEIDLNLAMESIWMSHPWRQFTLPPGSVQVTTVANTRAYALPQFFGRVPPKSFVRNLTQGSVLEPMDQVTLEGFFPGAGAANETAGPMEHYWIGNPVGVTTNVATTGESIEVVSDDSGDTDIMVVVEGKLLDGKWSRRQVRLTGTTPKSIPGTWSFVYRFGKSYEESSTPVFEYTASRGTVTLRTTGLTTLQELQPYQSALEFPSIYIYHTPDRTGDVLEIPTMVQPVRMAADADVCPEHWGPALIAEVIHEWKRDRRERGSGKIHRTPEYVTLMEFDNSAQRFVTAKRRPFRMNHI